MLFSFYIERYADKKYNTKLNDFVSIVFCRLCSNLLHNSIVFTYISLILIPLVLILLQFWS
jgi:hypothetical protein